MRDHQMLCGLVALLVFTGGCAHRPPRAQPPQEVVVQTPVKLEIKGAVGRIEQTEYRSSSLTRTYENLQLLKERFEDLDFVVQTALQKIDPEKGHLVQQLTTLKKEGDGDLNAMAYPEVGQSIDVTVDAQGRVFHVKGFSPNSIFYVPSISLPEKAVEVGDTWPMTAEWMSQENGVPLRLEMVTILKRFVKCGSQSCAELEVSGEVELAVATKKRTMEFKSELRGLMYFGLETGAIVWSQVRNSEALVAGQQKVRIESCLQARLLAPESERQEFAVQAKCSAEDIQKLQTASGQQGGPL